MNHTPGDNIEGDDGKPAVWDEFQWEEFMKEADKRTDLYMSLLEEYGDLPDADDIIARKMGWNDLADSNEELSEMMHEWTDFLNDEMEECEEWKKGTSFENMQTFDFEQLPAYRKAFGFSLNVIHLSRSELQDIQDPSLDILLQNVTLPAAKIAGGFGMGFEVESIGGNIANCKRGLIAANRVLSAIFDLHEKGFINDGTYLLLQEQAKEVRDELAIWIVELRERFRRGIS